MNKGFVDRLPNLERLHILAKFAVGKERKDAQQRLVGAVVPLLGNAAVPEWIVFQLIARYYGKRSARFAHLAINLMQSMPQRVGEKPENYKRRVLRVVKNASSKIEDYLKSLATYAEEATHAGLQERRVIL